MKLPRSVHAGPYLLLLVLLTIGGVSHVTSLAPLGPPKEGLPLGGLSRHWTRAVSSLRERRRLGLGRWGLRRRIRRLGRRRRTSVTEDAATVVAHLHERIRVLQEEVLQLRRRLSETRAGERSDTSSTSRRLREHVTELSECRRRIDELEAVLATSRSETEELRQALAASTAGREADQAAYRASLRQETKASAERTRALLQREFETEVSRMRRTLVEESRRLLRETEAEGNAQQTAALQRQRSRLTREAARRWREERRKLRTEAQAAVRKEKERMTTLLRALAEREQREEAFRTGRPVVKKTATTTTTTTTTHLDEKEEETKKKASTHEEYQEEEESKGRTKRQKKQSPSSPLRTVAS